MDIYNLSDDDSTVLVNLIGDRIRKLSEKAKPNLFEVEELEALERITDQMVF